MTDAAGLTAEQIERLRKELMDRYADSVANVYSQPLIGISVLCDLALAALCPSPTEPVAMNVTVWKDGSYLCQRPLDDVYSRDDPEWLCSIPLVSAYTVAPPAAVPSEEAWDWKVVYKALVDARTVMQSGGIRYSWMDAPINIANQYASPPASAEQHDCRFGPTGGDPRDCGKSSAEECEYPNCAAPDEALVARLRRGAESALCSPSLMSEAADRIAALAGAAALLREARDYVVREVVACGGNKCRELNCESCFSEETVREYVKNSHALCDSIDAAIDAALAAEPKHE